MWMIGLSAAKTQVLECGSSSGLERVFVLDEAGGDGLEQLVRQGRVGTEDRREFTGVHDESVDV